MATSPFSRDANMVQTTSELAQAAPQQSAQAALEHLAEAASQQAASSNGSRFRNVFYLTLTGILAMVLIFAATITALSFLPAGIAVTIVAFAGTVVAVVGTFIGSQTGYLIGSSGKEHAERRIDSLQSAILKAISEYSKGSK